MTYSAIALSEPPTLIWVNTTAVRTAHNPCSGISKNCAMVNDNRPLIVTRQQKRKRGLLGSVVKCLMRATSEIGPAPVIGDTGSSPFLSGPADWPVRAPPG